MTSTTKQREKNEAKRAKAAIEAKSRGAMLASIRIDPARITLAKLKFMGEVPDTPKSDTLRGVNFLNPN